MSITRQGRIVRGLCLALALSLVLVACGDDTKDTGAQGGNVGNAQEEKLGGEIRIDGSSTVAPLSTAAAELFREEHPDVRVTVGTSGTGGGFEKFCNGETDISDASRPIKEEEAANCQKNGIVYDEFQVANDGLSVVIHPDNDWAECMTVAQLKKIWDDGSTVSSWKQVDPKFPDVKLELFGAGTDSGTFDYFTKAINGEEGKSRTDYNATEDDNVTVQGVSGSKGGLGYFGLSYLQQNQGKLKGATIDGGSGCVEATTETVQTGKYTPLSRPLFIYPTKKLVERPEGVAFIEFYLANTAQITEQALFVDLNGEQKGKVAQQLEALKSGTGK